MTTVLLKLGTSVRFYELIRINYYYFPSDGISLAGVAMLILIIRCIVLSQLNYILMLNAELL
jgi:hypothetical protein